MRRAVPVPEDDAGFADDPADGGAGVAFLGAVPRDEDGAAFGGEGEAGLVEGFEELGGLPVESRGDFFGIEGGGLEAKARQVGPEALGDGHRRAIPGEVEAFEQVDAGIEAEGLRLALVEIVMAAVGIFRLRDVGVRGFEEFHLQGDLAVLGDGLELEDVGIDGFIPFCLRCLIRGLGYDRHGGKRGEGEEGAAVHG